MPVKASSARNSAVTSTTVEAVASGQDTPCRVTARAPNTKPPTCEKGRQLAEASRTMRPQIGTQGAGCWRAGMIASQARPSTQNSSNCQATMRAKPPQPAEVTAATTPPKPYQPTRATETARPNEGQDEGEGTHGGGYLSRPKRERSMARSAEGEGDRAGTMPVGTLVRWNTRHPHPALRADLSRIAGEVLGVRMNLRASRTNRGTVRGRFKRGS